MIDFLLCLYKNKKITRIFRSIGCFPLVIILKSFYNTNAYAHSFLIFFSVLLFYLLGSVAKITQTVD